MSCNNLKGIHVLVTGGGTGIGAVIARKFAAAGADVTICGRNFDTLSSTASSCGMRPVPMDVTDPESVRRGTEAAVSAGGPIRIHVANAGIAEGMPFAKMDFDFWRKIIATNLDGAFLSIRESLASMPARGLTQSLSLQVMRSDIQRSDRDTAARAAQKTALAFTRDPWRMARR